MPLEPPYRVEVVEVRVPAGGAVGGSAQRHLDKGDAALDQPPRQQTPLAEPAVAVSVTHG